MNNNSIEMTTNDEFELDGSDFEINSNISDFVADSSISEENIKNEIEGLKVKHIRIFIQFSYS